MVNEQVSEKLPRAVKTISTISAKIDKIAIASGHVISFMIIPMVGSLAYEVIVRYLFSAPTIWAEDISTMLYGCFFMLGSAYCLQRGVHIRTDFFYQNWSVRTKGVVDSIIYLFVFFPCIGFFTIISWNYAWMSVMLKERAISSPWMPYIWPVKLAMPISGMLLVIQGVSEVLKSLVAAVFGAEIGAKMEQMDV